MAVGGGQGETGAEGIGYGCEAERPQAGRRVREVTERTTGEDSRRQQGQPVRSVPHGQPEKEDAGRVLQLDGVRPVLLRAGPVHGWDRRQHIRQCRVLRADRAAGRVLVHISHGEVRPQEHAALGQSGHGRRLHTDNVFASEWVYCYKCWLQSTAALSLSNSNREVSGSPRGSAESEFLEELRLRDFVLERSRGGW